jgi:hypothetical protein
MQGRSLYAWTDIIGGLQEISGRKDDLLTLQRLAQSLSSVRDPEDSRDPVRNLTLNRMNGNGQISRLGEGWGTTAAT